MLGYYAISNLLYGSGFEKTLLQLKKRLEASEMRFRNNIED